MSRKERMTIQKRNGLFVLVDNIGRQILPGNLTEQAWRSFHAQYSSLAQASLANRNWLKLSYPAYFQTKFSVSIYLECLHEFSSPNYLVVPVRVARMYGLSKRFVERSQVDHDFSLQTL